VPHVHVVPPALAGQFREVTDMRRFLFQGIVSRKPTSESFIRIRSGPRVLPRTLPHDNNEGVEDA
jgi:hypothetical protein